MFKIGFIGAGKVGKTLGLYFKKKGATIVGYSSRNQQSAINVAQTVGTKAFENNKQLIDSCNILWITTNDDAIQDVVNDIATINIQQQAPKLCLHASGTHTLNILKPLTQQGWHIATAHPLLAFSHPHQALPLLSETYFITEKEHPILEALLKLTGNKTQRIETEKKTLYHVASVVLSNYLVTLFHISKELYKKTGIENQDLTQITMPLIQSVIKNINNTDGKEALTGPIKREDENTIKKHLECLQKESPEYLPFYKTMGEETMKMLNNFKLNKIFKA